MSEGLFFIFVMDCSKNNYHFEDTYSVMVKEEPLLIRPFKKGLVLNLIWCILVFKYGNQSGFDKLNSLHQVQVFLLQI